MKNNYCQLDGQYYSVGQCFSTGGPRPTGGHMELPGGSRDGRGNYSFKLPGQIKKIVLDLTMKTTTYSRQTSPRVSTIHI